MLKVSFTHLIDVYKVLYSFVLSAGRDVWLSTTRAFADQLESQGQHQRAVLYYLACHDTYKAIDVFKKQAMYRYVNMAHGVSRGCTCR